MKTRFALKLMAFVAIVIVTAACKDDDEPKLTDTAKFDGSTIKLTSALTMFDYFGRVEGETTLHDQDITFFSEGLTIEDDLSISGTGDAITFKAVSNIADVVGEGEYTITDAVEGEAALFTYHDASIRVGLAPGTSEGTIHKIVSGVFKSSNFEGGMRYEFEGTTEGGKSLKFSFSGNEWSAEKE
jgi:hypothetical protein